MATLSDNINNGGQPDFSSDQAAILRDIARNGAGDEASAYGFSDAGSNGHSSGLSNSLHDLEDPAALLESLANFEHGPSGNEANTAVSNDHFASLLQAAATATGEEAAQTGHDQSRRSTVQSTTPEQYGFPQSPPGSAQRKRKRHERDDDQSFGFITSKQRRRSSPEDEEQQLAREREIWGPEDNEDEGGSPALEYQQTPIATADARAVGVHSAAALFRRPSTASKKYTRPPMSKLFTSLELTPEQFLHLQAAAKNYMLDEKYPERSECVGNRGRGDTDMIKLKLFGCVKSFLEDEGWGERCFGENAPGADQRKLKWPQMKNKVISLVTPLMRRMVTNERQRKYAIESRKNAAKAGGRRQHEQGSATPQGSTPQPDGQSQLLPTSSVQDIDPKLNQYHYNLDSSLPPEDRPTTANTTRATSVFAKKAAEGEGLKYHVSIMHEGRRLMPRFTLTPSTCPGFSSLVQHIHSIMDDEGRKVSSVKILGPSGLVDVGDEDTWREAIETVKQTEWMDGEAKCVVHVE